MRHDHKWIESITETSDFWIYIGAKLDINCFEMSNNYDERMDIKCKRKWILMTVGGKYWILVYILIRYRSSPSLHTHTYTLFVSLFFSLPFRPIRFSFTYVQINMRVQTEKYTIYTKNKHRDDETEIKWNINSTNRAN